MAFTKITHAGIGSTGTVLLENLEVTGVGTFGGSVSVGGTLTYEDVTNVDSVGLITARNGIVVGSGITLSKDGDIFATGITTVSGNVKVGTGITLSPDGDIFATGITTTGSLVSSGAISGTTGTFSGAVSGTTGTFTGDVDIADKIVHTGDTNTAIRFPATDTFTVETAGSEAIRITSDGDLGVGMGSPWARLVVHETSSNTSLTGHNYLASQSGMSIENGSTTDGSFSAYSARVKNNAGTQQSGSLAFKSTSSGYTPEIHLTQRTGAGVQATRLLITSDGKVGINEASPDQALHVKSTGSDTVPLRVQSAGASSRIGFEAGGSSNSYNVGCGAAAAPNAGNEFAIFTNDTERLRVDSSGRLLVGQTSSVNGIYGSPPPRFSVSTTTASPAIFATYSNDVYGSRIDLIKSRSGTVGGTTVVQANDAVGEIVFGGADGDQFHPTALIQSAVESGVGNNDMPGDLRFYTNAGATTATERFRITSDGSIGFGLASSYAAETPIDVFANWANTRSNVDIVSSYHRKLPINERGDITLTARHSPSKDGAVGYVGPFIDFRSTNSSNEEWTVAQVVGGTDPLGGNGYQGGLSIFTGNGGNNDPSGRRNQGDAPTLTAVFAPFRITTFCSTSSQGAMALHITKNLAANNVQSDMIAFDVGGAGRGKIVSASSGSGNPSFGAYSDRRLKTNFRDYTGGYDRIKSIPVKLYDEVLNDQTKSVFGDNVKTDVIGWIADEVQSVFPEAVVGTKDEVDSDGKPVYQSLTEGTFLPDAIQAIQKLIEKVETLETKVAALEG